MPSPKEYHKILGNTGTQSPPILLSSTTAFTKFSRKVKCFAPTI